MAKLKVFAGLTLQGKPLDQVRTLVITTSQKSAREILKERLGLDLSAAVFKEDWNVSDRENELELLKEKETGVWFSEKIK